MCRSGYDAVAGRDRCDVTIFLPTPIITVQLIETRIISFNLHMYFVTNVGLQ